MNKLPLSKRVQILAMLCEGSSMRSISRVADVSINTVSKLLVEAGEACLILHDETVRNVKASRIQCDEIWSFCHAKQKNVANAKAAPEQPADDPLIRCRSLFKQTEPPLYSQNLGDALDPANTASGAWVDSAYRSAEIEAAVADAANRSHPIQGYE
jgi:lambda repressor-like predicted transcriptional regulator